MLIKKYIIDFVLNYLGQREYLVQFLAPLVRDRILSPEEKNFEETSFFSAIVSVGNAALVIEAYNKLHTHKRRDILNKIDKNGASSLDRAYLLPTDGTDREKIIQFLLNQHAEILGYAALNYFIKIGNLGMVEILCRHSIDFSVKNKDGKTPLMVALKKENAEIVRFLVGKHRAEEL